MWMLFSFFKKKECLGCTARQEVIEFQRQMIESLLLKIDAPIQGSGKLIEDFEDKPRARITADGDPIPDTFDD